MLYLFDLPGMKSYVDMRLNTNVIMHANICFITIDLMDPEWQTQVTNYLMLLKTIQLAGFEQMIVLLCTKCDTYQNVDMEAFNKYVQKHKIDKFFVISAKTGQGIDEVLKMEWPENEPYYFIDVATS